MAEPLRIAAHPEVGALLAPRADIRRARLLAAVCNVAAHKGIAHTTVADIVRVAQVSRASFYEQFSSKEDCLVAACRYGHEMRLEISTNATASVLAAGGSWQDGLRAGARAHLQALADSPEFTRATALEIQNAGEQGNAERIRAIREWALGYKALFEFAASQDPTLTVPSLDTLFVLCAGQEQIAITWIREDKIASLADLEDTTVATASAILLGTAKLNSD